MAHLLGIKSPHASVGHSLIPCSVDFPQNPSNSLFTRLAFTSRTHRDFVCQLRPVDGVSTDRAQTPDPNPERGSSTTIPADRGVLRYVPSNSARNQLGKVNLPPRICTLRAFGKSPEGVMTNKFDETMSAFWKSLAANIEFKAKIQDWEILSGRLAMMVFASALLLEAVTGDSVFQKLEPHRLLEVAGAFVMSSLFAAGFAVAWSAKTRVAYTMSKGYEKFLNSLIDNVIDGLFFDDDR